MVEKTIMPDEIFHTKNDELLVPFLTSENEAEAEVFLNLLFETTVIPQIRKTLASYLTLLMQDKEEIQSDAQTRILGKLRTLRTDTRTGTGLTAPIRNFSAYISKITVNGRKDFILAKQPEWRRLDNRLKRLRDEDVLHFSTGDEGPELISERGQPVRRSKLELEKIVSGVREKFPNHLFLKTQEIVPIILEIAGGALTKNELLKAILEITESARFEEIELPEELGDHFNYMEEEYLLTKRQSVLLRRVWDEIRIFPPHQRKVLLLSLKESRRVEAVSLLLKKRIATIREIADALELSFEEFSDVFSRLPLSSTEIADFLGIPDGEKTSKEQKVDNLRSIARGLLRRRLKIK